jgi:hypothetical protein
MHGYNAEASLKVILKDFTESLEDLRYGSIGEMVDGRKTDLATQSQEERYLIDEEDVTGEKHLPVKLQ